MSRLALGTVQFGLPYGIANQDGQVTRSVAKAMLQHAAANGIDTLDTAIAYGESETCLGEVGAAGFKLVTKLPAIPVDCVDVSGWVKSQVSESLGRLGVSAVYGLLLHQPMQLLGQNGKALFQALHSLKDSGQVQKVGVSIYSLNELAALAPQYHFDLVQAPFNLIDRRLESTGWMKRLKDSDVEIHTRSVFLQGLLLMGQSDVPAEFAQWGSLWNRWHRWLKDHNVSAVKACLEFSLSYTEIDRVIVGADSVAHLKQIVDSVSKTTVLELPDLACEDLNLIDPSRWKK